MAFSLDHMDFTGDVPVAPQVPAPQLEFFLRLAASDLVRCNPKPQGGTAGADQVTDFALSCPASKLPSTYSPVLEVVGQGPKPVFVPATFVNNSNTAWVDWWPPCLGLALAVGLVGLGWGLANGSSKRRRAQDSAKGRFVRLSMVEIRAAGRDADALVELVERAVATVESEATSRRKETGVIRLKASVKADVAWNGSDSWVTNVGLVNTALLAATTAASGSLAGVLPGFPAARFGVLVVLFGVLLAMGPVLYGLGTRPKPGPGKSGHEHEGPGARDGLIAKMFGTSGGDGSPQGTVWGVLVAAVATLTAIMGQLTLLWFGVMLSAAEGAARWALYVALAVIAGVVAWFCTKGVAYMLLPDYKSPISHQGRRSGTL